MQNYITVLSIAGSDPSGGAGIQADLKTCAALGCYGLSVITALTAQNSKGISKILPISGDFIKNQIDTLMNDFNVDIVKIGMIPNKEVLSILVNRLDFYDFKYIIIDPVLNASHGENLMQNDAIGIFRDVLLPKATIITPNLLEAAILLDQPQDAFIEADLDKMKKICQRLGKFTKRAVVLKGGHHINATKCIDLLYFKDQDDFFEFSSQKVPTPNLHGTGCTFSTAIACFLAKNHSIKSAIKQAKIFISNSIEEGAQFRLGNGPGPVHHFFQFWK